MRVCSYSIVARREDLVPRGHWDIKQDVGFMWTGGPQGTGQLHREAAVLHRFVLCLWLCLV